MTLSINRMLKDPVDRNKLLGTFAADMVGSKVISYLAESSPLVNASVLSPTWTILGSSLLGLSLTILPWMYFNNGLRHLLSEQDRMVRMPLMFLYHASMAYLSTFIGLAIVASFATVALNPFSLPCLMGVGIAGAFIFSVMFAVMMRTHFDPGVSLQSLGIAGLIKKIIVCSMPIYTLDELRQPLEAPSKHRMPNESIRYGLFVHPYGYELQEGMDYTRPVY